MGHDVFVIFDHKVVQDVNLMGYQIFILQLPLPFIFPMADIFSSVSLHLFPYRRMLFFCHLIPVILQKLL